jgi:hypothetical protein
MGSKQYGPEALFMSLFCDQSFRPNSIFGPMFEQSSKHAKMNPFDIIREHLCKNVRRHEAPILRLSRLESGRNPARKPDFRPGCIIA